MQKFQLITKRVCGKIETFSMSVRGIQDTRQIVDGMTKDKENNNKKGGFLNIRQKTTHEKSYLTLINEPTTSFVRHQCNGPMNIKVDYILMK